MHKNILILVSCILMFTSMISAQAIQDTGKAQPEFNKVFYEQSGIQPENVPTADAGPRKLILDEIPPLGLLLVPNSTNKTVMAFDPYDGALIDEYFFPISPGSLSTPIHMLWNHEQTSLLVSDQLKSVVQQFTEQGVFEETFAPAHGEDPSILANIRGMYMHDDGQLLVTVAGGGNANAVAAFDTEGNFTGNFIDNHTGGLEGPWSIVYRQSHNDYLVSADGSNGVLRFNTDGEFLDMFATELGFPQQIQVLLNGNVLIANFGVEPPSGILEYCSEGSLLNHYDAMEGTRGVFELGNGNLLVTTAGGVHEISRNNQLLETKISGNARHITHITPPGVDFYALTADMTPENAGHVHGSGYYPEGHTINLSANPDIYHDFLYWTDADENIISDQASFGYEMIAEDHSLTAHFDPKDTFLMNFLVMEDSDEEDPVQGAEISIAELTSLTSDQHGEAAIDMPVDVFDTVFVKVSKEGYLDQHISIEPGNQDMTMEIRLRDHILPPPFVQIYTEGMMSGTALMTWNDPTMLQEFRYDDGHAHSQLGFNGGSLNSILGAAHRNESILHEMTWYLSGNPNHETVKLWVMALDENGNPDRENVLYTAENIPTEYNRWNLYEFSQVIEAPDGFFLGISADGFLGLATDNGVGEPWQFQPETQYGIFDITDPTLDFTPIEEWNFDGSYLLRAYGIDFGEISHRRTISGLNVTENHALHGVDIDKPYFTGEPESLSGNAKVFAGFNVYLNDRITPVAANYTDTEYLFTDLPPGEHRAGVQSVYTTGLSEIAAQKFHVAQAAEYHTVTLYVHMHDAEFVPEEDVILVTGDMLGWLEPGFAAEKQIMTPTDDPMIYTTSFDLMPGEYSYKYFLNEGFGGAEWSGEPNRIIEVGNEDKEVHNVFGSPSDEALSATETGIINIRVYPNPASDVLHFHSDTNISEISVHSMLGRNVYHTSVNDKIHTLSTEQFESGLYMIRILTPYETVIRKVLIHKN